MTGEPRGSTPSTWGLISVALSSLRGDGTQTGQSWAGVAVVGRVSGVSV